VEVAHRCWQQSIQQALCGDNSCIHNHGHGTTSQNHVDHVGVGQQQLSVRQFCLFSFPSRLSAYTFNPSLICSPFVRCQADMGAPAALIETWALYTFGSLVILARIVCRWRMIGIYNFKPDDYLIVLAWVSWVVKLLHLKQHHSDHFCRPGHLHCHDGGSTHRRRTWRPPRPHNTTT